MNTITNILNTFGLVHEKSLILLEMRILSANRSMLRKSLSLNTGIEITSHVDRDLCPHKSFAIRFYLQVTTRKQIGLELEINEHPFLICLLLINVPPRTRQYMGNLVVIKFKGDLQRV